MAFTGRIDWTAVGTGSGTRTPNTFSLLGEDGKHYCGIRQDSTSRILRVGCVETNTLIAQLSNTTWNTDVLATLAGTSGTYVSHCVLPVRGTAYFGVIGGGTPSSANETHIVCVFYKINSSGTLVLDSTRGFAYVSDADLDYSLAGTGDTGRVFDTLLVGTELYFVLTGREAHPFANPFSRGVDDVLAHAPFDAQTISLSVGSWSAQVTESPFASDFLSGSSGGGRAYGNRACLINRTGGVIGLLHYHDAALATPSAASLWYTEFDTLSQTTTGANNVSSSFGVPFADVGKLFSGLASADISDDYTSPTTSGTEVIFSRTFTDNIDCLRMRRFTFASAGSVSSIGSTDLEGFTITAVNGQLEGGAVYREGGSILATLRDRRFYYFLRSGGGGGGQTRVIGA